MKRVIEPVMIKVTFDQGFYDPTDVAEVHHHIFLGPRGLEDWTLNMKGKCIGMSMWSLAFSIVMA